LSFPSDTMFGLHLCANDLIHLVDRLFHLVDRLSALPRFPHQISQAWSISLRQSQPTSYRPSTVFISVSTSPHPLVAPPSDAPVPVCESHAPSRAQLPPRPPPPIFFVVLLHFVAICLPVCVWLIPTVEIVLFLPPICGFVLACNSHLGAMLQRSPSEGTGRVSPSFSNFS
jgi:hypothetical protein